MLAKVPLNDIKESIKHNLDENIIIFNFFRLLLFYDERHIETGNWGCGVYNGIFEL